MPEIDLSVTISAIIAVAAIISPILTTLINNSHQMKMKKIEMKEKQYERTVEYQRNILQSYLKASGRCLGCPDDEALKEYHESYFLALMYVSDDVRDKMIVINHYIDTSRYERSTSAIESLIPLIEKQLQSL